MFQYDLFISYSRNDIDLVKKLRDDLTDKDVKTWIDQTDLKVGDSSWDEKIRNAISDSKAILLCASPTARKSPYVFGEIQIAKNQDKKIYPAWINGEKWTDCVPIGLIVAQYADLREDSYEEGLNALIQTINGESTSIEPLKAAKDEVNTARIASVTVLLTIIFAILLLIGVISNENPDGETPEPALITAGTTMPTNSTDFTDETSPITTPEQSEIPSTNERGGNPAQFQQIGSVPVIIVATDADRVNVRGAAIETSTIIGVIDIGSQVEIVATVDNFSGSWSLVSIQNGSGNYIEGFQPLIANAGPFGYIKQNLLEPVGDNSISDLPYLLIQPDTSLEEAVSTLADRLQEENEWEPETEVFEGSEMVLVPPGCFNMGNTNGGLDEEPIHRICVTYYFWLDRYEVTQKEYGSIDIETDVFGNDCSEVSSAPDQPQNCVTWFEAREFCEARNARLPNEAEWEYAAKGPDSLRYPWGDSYLSENVIGVDDPEYGNQQTAPVGSRSDGQSWVGAFDTSGNVYEWLNTIYDQGEYPYPYQSNDGREEPNNDFSRRVIRGGSFLAGEMGLITADRSYSLPDFTIYDLGFRCARDYVPGEIP